MAQSAAAQVFATPELLENILLLFAHNKKNKSSGWSSRHVAKSNADKATLWQTSQLLVHELHVWQRINKATRDIILDSSRLRRVMWTQPYPARSPETVSIRDGVQSLAGVSARHILAPVEWLLNRTKDVLGPANHESQVLMNNEKKGPDLRFKLSCVIVRNGPPPHDFLEDAMNLQEATWKSFPICRIADFDGKITIAQHCNINREVWYEETFEVKQATTLGEFYTWYLDGRQSITLEKHRLWFKMLQDKGELHKVEARPYGTRDEWVLQNIRGGLIDR